MWILDAFLTDNQGKTNPTRNYYPGHLVYQFKVAEPRVPIQVTDFSIAIFLGWALTSLCVHLLAETNYSFQLKPSFYKQSYTYILPEVYLRTLETFPATDYLTSSAEHAEILGKNCMAMSAKIKKDRQIFLQKMQGAVF